MLFYLVLIAASPFLVSTFPQTSDDTGIIEADGFVFNGSTAINGEQKITSTTIVSNTLPDGYEACLRGCLVALVYNPVCGTDNIDYINPAKLNCARQCGKDVTINYYGRCSTRMS